MWKNIILVFHFSLWINLVFSQNKIQSIKVKNSNFNYEYFNYNSGNLISNLEFIQLINYFKNPNKYNYKIHFFYSYLSNSNNSSILNLSLGELMYSNESNLLTLTNSPKLLININKVQSRLLEDRYQKALLNQGSSITNFRANIFTWQRKKPQKNK